MLKNIFLRKAYAREYYLKNKDKIKIKAKAKAYAREYYLKNKDKIKIKNHTYYLKNIDKIKMACYLRNNKKQLMIEQLNCNDKKIKMPEYNYWDNNL